MADFSIEIAGKAIRVSSLFDSTRDYCGRYLTEKAPDFSVAVTREDLAFEQRELDDEADREGMRRRVFTDPFLDRAAIQRKTAEGLFDSGVLLFHGSTVALDGEAYLFTAECGTGKSTHTRLWRQVFGDRAVMVNDDKPFLKFTDDGVLACGAPWSGKHGLDSNITVPLAGICVLRRGSSNRIRPLEREAAMDMLCKQSVPPLAPEKQAQYHAMVEKLAQTVPLWEMECTKDPEAALVSHRAMCRGVSTSTHSETR